MKRRVRAHFYFPSLNKDIKEYVSTCKHCAMFTSKNRKHKLKPHALHEYNCWEKISLDLFGPMPNNKSILVAQDMVSKFPVAKMLTKTNADHVIEALEEF